MKQLLFCFFIFISFFSLFLHSSMQPLPTKFFYNLYPYSKLLGINNLKQTCTVLYEDCNIHDFLQKNKDICFILDNNDHLDLLNYYTKTNNELMFSHIINNENQNNQIRRKKILQFFYYKKSEFSNITQNMRAYQAIGKKCNTKEAYFLRKAYLSKDYYDAIKIILKSKPHLINRAILDHPISHYEKSSHGTIIHYAALYNLVDIFTFLISYGADINAEDKTRKKNTPLHLAVKHNHYDCVQKLIELGANINTQNKNGDTALHIAAKKGLNTIILLLIEKGAHINSKNHSGQSPLHVTSNIWYPKIVQLLIQHGADIKLKDYCGKPAMHDSENTESDRDIANRGFPRNPDGGFYFNGLFELLP